MMFNYSLPGGLNTHTYFDSSGQIKFTPPVYEQRITTSIRILGDPRWAEHFKKVADLGCGEMQLLPLLRRMDNLSHITAVDINEQILVQYQYRAVPLLADFLKCREHPLRIEVLQGSLTAPVEQLKNIDAVVCLEVIEHLYADVLDEVPKNIFGYIMPKLAIFSTPNADFNVLFDSLLSNGFRHLDHKFEWSRKEFKKWCLTICENYPNYKVAFIGVGSPPPEHKKLGNVTQIAIFARKDILEEPLVQEIPNSIILPCPQSSEKYKEIYSVDFPVAVEERTLDEKIWDETQYVMNNGRAAPRYQNTEKQLIQIPLNCLDVYLEQNSATRDDLLRVLKNKKIQVDDQFIILPMEDEYAENVRYDDYLNDEYGWRNSNYDDDDDELGAVGGIDINDCVDDNDEECWDT